MNISSDASQFITISPPLVISPEAIIVTCNGNVVGKVTATYDFSGLPTQFHAIVLSYIQGGRVNIIDAR